MDKLKRCLVPNLEDRINQLQELYQKKYLEQQTEYEFAPEDAVDWCCVCRCNGVAGIGYGASKSKGKNSAAFMVLKSLYKAAGTE